MVEPDPQRVSRLLKWSSMGKRLIAAVLMLMMFVLVAIVTVELVWAFLSPILPGGPISVEDVVMTEDEMLGILGLFLTVLIALELIETVEVYFRKHAIHVEIVVLVAIIALARKVIILDLAKYEPLVLFALGFLVVALGATYYLVRKAAPPDA